VLSPAADFYEFTAENGRRKTQNFSLPLSSTISTATFRKGSRLLYYKTDVDDGCDSQLDFLKPKFAVSAFPPSKSSPRELPLSKREGIPKLLCGISPSKKGFWIELPTNESSRDLVSNVE